MRYTHIIVALLLAATANAQTDSVRTEYKTEDESISKSEVKRFIRYITRANVEEKTLLKVGLWPALDRSNSYEDRTLRIGTNVEIAIEQKITPALSVLAGVSGYLSYGMYRALSGSIGGISNLTDPRYLNRPEWITQAEFSGRIGFRYYHNMGKRIEKGLSANNLSGNYLTAQVAESFSRFNTGRYRNLLTGDRFLYRRRDNLLGDPQPRVLIAYGVQRRLGKWGYVDFNAGPEIQFTGGTGARGSFQLNAIIGIGW